MRQVASVVQTSIVLVCYMLSMVATAHARQLPGLTELRQLSLEELANLTVTSVSKAEETLSGAPAAITVVTNEDIRRSGATTIPDALRMAPGIHVARQTSNIWALGSRGFSATTSEKLLVLTDSRSVYTPLFSGVFWDTQDLLLEDVERIEIISGPGASLWGSNAVNGVINITTKNARDTQGLYVASGGGTEEQFALSARYGGRVGNRGHYRVFGKYTTRDNSFTTGTSQRDDWQLGHVGARADWEYGSANSLTLQGDAYGSDIGRLSPSVTIIGRSAPSGALRTNASGGNVLGLWRRRPSAASDLQVRVYYDRTHRDDPSFTDDLDTLDADLQHRSTWPRRQEITWGANYRFTSNRNTGKGLFALDPAASRDQVVSGFVQHQIQLGDALRLTTGTKLEHNDFAGADFQPSARAAWDLAPRHTLWGAISRAVRIPTRLERDIAIVLTLPGANPELRLLGNAAFDAERLMAFEAGYRWQHSSSFLVDVAAYHNRYRGLASLELGDPFMTDDGRSVYPIGNENLTDGHVQGFGAQVTVIPAVWWRLSASSSGTWMDLTAHGQDLNRGVFQEGSTPRHQFGLQSRIDLGADVTLDAQFRHLTAIRRIPVIVDGTGLPGYAELDVRLAWLAFRPFELAIVGQNLLHDHHAEFGPPAARGEIQRGVYAQVTWRR